VIKGKKRERERERKRESLKHLFFDQNHANILLLFKKIVFFFFFFPNILNQL